MKRGVVLWSLLFAGLSVQAQPAQLSSRDDIFIKQLFYAGLGDKLNENYDRALLNFSKVVAVDPVNSAAYYEIALLSYRLEKMTAAEAAIKRAVAIDKNNIWYWKLMAELYKRTGNMTALVPAFDRLIALSPNELSFYFDKSNALLLAGKKEEALAGYTLIEKKFGSSTALKQARQRAMENPSVPTAVSPVSSADPITQAAAYSAKGDFPAAVKLLDNVASAHQDDPLFFSLYGDILLETGNLQSSLVYYKKALKLTGQLYGVWEKTLRIHIQLGLFKEMLPYGEAALSVYPNQAILYYYMAFASHRADLNGPALSYIKTAIQMDGDNKSLQAQIFALQAEILIDEHKPAAADAAFDKALILDPENYQLMNNYAYYLALRNENLKKADLLISTAAKALPADGSIADTYAFVLFKQSKYDLARVWIEKALANNAANNSVYLEHYGDILFFLGEQEKAVVQWQRSRTSGNDSALLKQKINEKKYLK
jgi:tetratricopeptide (TPR) repeat protein